MEHVFRLTDMNIKFVLKIFKFSSQNSKCLFVFIVFTNLENYL